ncbi:MAG: hypothetical protein QXJ17_04325 [Nitrososphaeria archaeon]
MSKRKRKCYEDYVPWVRRLNLDELEEKVSSIELDEGIKLNALMKNEKMVKIFINKTGQEYVITIVSSDSMDETFLYSSGQEVYDALKKMVKTIKEAYLY